MIVVSPLYYKSPMSRDRVIQIRVSGEELAVLRANAGSEKLVGWLRRLGLEAGPVVHSAVTNTRTGEVLAVTDVTERPTRLEGKRTVSDRVASSARPQGQAGSTPAPSAGKYPWGDTVEPSARWLSGRSGQTEFACKRALKDGTWPALIG